MPYTKCSCISQKKSDNVSFHHSMHDNPKSADNKTASIFNMFEYWNCEKKKKKQDFVWFYPLSRSK